MKLTEYALGHLKKFITGDNEMTPKQSAPELVSLFNSVGMRDVYKAGLPEGLSRNPYALNRLEKINGSKGLKEVIEIIFSKRHFDGKGFNLSIAAEEANKIIEPEGYRLIEVDGSFIVNSNDVYADGVKAEVHFEELQGQLKKELLKAKYMIWVAVAWFTDKELYDILVKKHSEGVNIQVIILNDEINIKDGLNFGKDFYTSKAPKRPPFDNIMHHKFCIIDLKTVVHGSYNWTIKAKYNNETLEVLEGRDTAEQFANEFIKLKNVPKG